MTHPGGGRDVRSGCLAIADNIGQFDRLDCMPIQIDIARLDDGCGISQTLQSNNACWHKSCRLQFCNMKLQRARKRAQVDKQGNGDTNKPSPVKRRSSLQSSSRGEKDSTTSVCFFCDKGDEDERLHTASTANIDATVRECAI